MKTELDMNMDVVGYDVDTFSLIVKYGSLRFSMHVSPNQIETLNKNLKDEGLPTIKILKPSKSS